jgi:hypothetical protein
MVHSTPQSKSNNETSTRKKRFDNPEFIHAPSSSVADDNENIGLQKKASSAGSSTGEKNS